MDEPDTRILVAGALVGLVVGVGAGLAIDELVLGVTMGFALAVVFVAGLLGRE